MLTLFNYVGVPHKERKQVFGSPLQIIGFNVNPTSFQFTLPGHKADRFFEGSLVLIQATGLDNDAWGPFTRYLTFRDHCFPLQAELWLKKDGTIPTHAWFLRYFCCHFSGDVGGQSLHVGGATALAEAGIPPHMIQVIGDGHWKPFRFTSIVTWPFLQPSFTGHTEPLHSPSSISPFHCVFSTLSLVFLSFLSSFLFHYLSHPPFF